MFHNPYYGAQAYTSETVQEDQIKQYIDSYTPPAYLRPGILNRGKFLEVLPLMYTAKNIIPDYPFTAKTPGNLRQEQQGHPQKNRRPSFYHLWDETAICFKKPSWLYEWLSFSILFLLMFLLLIEPLIISLSVLSLDYSLSDIFSQESPFPFLTLTYGAIGATIVCWVLKKLLPRQGLGHIYEFNRRTGLVTKIKYPVLLGYKKPKATSVPFSEMEGIVYLRPGRSPTASSNPELIFQHRFSHFSFTLQDDCQIFVLFEQNAKNYWYFLQNFMDISKPLPDIPLFEKYRHKDPTTVEHDQNKHRKQDYWLNMDDKLWTSKLRVNLERLRRQ